MNKAVFLDRDGTINIDKDYLYKWDDFEWAPHVLEDLRTFKEQGYLLILITNQSGIARGMYTESDLMLLHQKMQHELEKVGAAFDGIYYCPHLPDGAVGKYRANCGCRKPKNGLFKQAIEDFQIDPKESFAIGDKERDILPLIELGGRGFLVDKNQGELLLCSQMKA